VKLNWGAVKDGDEFEYSGKPQSKWSLYSGQGHAGNGKRVPEAFNVSGGILTCSGDKGGNTGGMAFSRNQMYGRYEVRMRTYSVDPKAGGAKYHPVLILWPQDDRWPQGAEYDFFESDCDSGVAGCYMHYPSDKVEQQHFEKKLDIQNWHNYAIEWKKDAITGYIDGEQWWRITEARMQAPRPMHLTIQLDNFNGTNQCPGKMDVAWVRYYDV
jgi:beta-glucanase (GH16 family)